MCWVQAILTGKREARGCTRRRRRRSKRERRRVFLLSLNPSSLWATTIHRAILFANERSNDDGDGDGDGDDRPSAAPCRNPPAAPLQRAGLLREDLCRGKVFAVEVCTQVVGRAQRPRRRRLLPLGAEGGKRRVELARRGERVAAAALRHLGRPVCARAQLWLRVQGGRLEPRLRDLDDAGRMDGRVKTAMRVA